MNEKTKADHRNFFTSSSVSSFYVAHEKVDPWRQLDYVVASFLYDACINRLFGELLTGINCGMLRTTENEKK